MPAHIPNTGACVTELAALMLQLVATSQHSSVRVSDRNRKALPYVCLDALLMELSVCRGGFPKLQVAEGSWNDVQPTATPGVMLLKLTPLPGAPPVYITITPDGLIRRLPPKRRVQ